MPLVNRFSVLCMGYTVSRCDLIPEAAAPMCAANTTTAGHEVPPTSNFTGF
jgi:hypothetical protein